MQVRLFGPFVVLLATACSNNGTPNDPFFSFPKEQWVAMADGLPLKEVYRLYKRSLDVPRPADTRLAESLGKRGRASVELWIRDLEATGSLGNSWEFGPILTHAYRHTGFSVCQDDPQLYADLIQALSVRWNFRDRHLAQKMVDPFCFNGTVRANAPLSN